MTRPCDWAASKDPCLLQAALEVAHSFREKTNFFLSYLLRTVLAQVVAILLVVFLIVSSRKPIFEHSKPIPCKVHDYLYECSGIPTGLYMYTVICGERYLKVLSERLCEPLLRRPEGASKWDSRNLLKTNLHC